MPAHYKKRVVISGVVPLLRDLSPNLVEWCASDEGQAAIHDSIEKKLIHIASQEASRVISPEALDKPLSTF